MLTHICCAWIVYKYEGKIKQVGTTWYTWMFPKNALSGGKFCPLFRLIGRGRWLWSEGGAGQEGGGGSVEYLVQWLGHTGEGNSTWASEHIKKAGPRHKKCQNFTPILFQVQKIYPNKCLSYGKSQNVIKQCKLKCTWFLFNFYYYKSALPFYPFATQY